MYGHGTMHVIGAQDPAQILQQQREASLAQEGSPTTIDDMEVLGQLASGGRPNPAYAPRKAELKAKWMAECDEGRSCSCVECADPPRARGDSP
jgi:hypothetical protein